MAGALSWDAEQVAREVEYYRKRINAEWAAQEAETDKDAVAIRLGVPEIVPAADPAR